ncbi:MAG: methyltransferase [Planctomycetaceae bacterium]
MRSSTAMSTDYLAIEPFLKDALQGRALQSAFDLGIIDRLAAADADVTVDAALKGLDCDRPGGSFLLQVLASANVLRLQNEQVQLTNAFRNALRFRDLMMTKLQFAQLVAADYFECLPQLLRSAEDFMGAAKLFELFDYSRCIEITTGNCMQASRWMQLTTMLTRYEGPVCCDAWDFGRHRHMLDVGGNSGEFAMQVCRREPTLTATVLDLPVVCQVGMRHLQHQPEANRIQFHAADMVHDDFPVGADLICWKSVLHDWPDSEVQHLLQKSFDQLPVGGRILIFERCQWDSSTFPVSYGQLPVLLFFRSYRSPETYDRWLTNCGFRNVTTKFVQLDVPFVLMSGER